MQISGLENITPEQLDREIQRGGNSSSSNTVFPC